MHEPLGFLRLSICRPGAGEVGQVRAKSAGCGRSRPGAGEGLNLRAFEAFFTIQATTALDQRRAQHLSPTRPRHGAVQAVPDMTRMRLILDYGIQT